jgi:hypothetical protein
MLGELCDRGNFEKLVPGKYATVRWRERDEPDEEEEIRVVRRAGIR